jgi:hypothetical protein
MYKTTTSQSGKMLVYYSGFELLQEALRNAGLPESYVPIATGQGTVGKISLGEYLGRVRVRRDGNDSACAKNIPPRYLPEELSIISEYHLVVGDDADEGRFREVALILAAREALASLESGTMGLMISNDERAIENEYELGKQGKSFVRWLGDQTIKITSAGVLAPGLITMSCLLHDGEDREESDRIRETADPILARVDEMDKMSHWLGQAMRVVCLAELLPTDYAFPAWEERVGEDLKARVPDIVLVRNIVTHDAGGAIARRFEAWWRAMHAFRSPKLWDGEDVRAAIKRSIKRLIQAGYGPVMGTECELKLRPGFATHLHPKPLKEPEESDAPASQFPPRRTAHIDDDSSDKTLPMTDDLTSETASQEGEEEEKEYEEEEGENEGEGEKEEEEVIGEFPDDASEGLNNGEEDEPTAGDLPDNASEDLHDEKKGAEEEEGYDSDGPLEIPDLPDGEVEPELPDISFKIKEWKGKMHKFWAEHGDDVMNADEVTWANNDGVFWPFSRLVSEGRFLAKDAIEDWQRRAMGYFKGPVEFAWDVDRLLTGWKELSDEQDARMKKAELTPKDLLLAFYKNLDELLPLLGDGITRAATTGVPERMLHLVEAFDHVANMINPEDEHLKKLQDRMREMSLGVLQAAWSNMLRDLSDESYREFQRMMLKVMVDLWEDEYEMPKHDWLQGSEEIHAEEIPALIQDIGIEIIVGTGHVAKHHELMHRVEDVKRRFPKYARDVTHAMQVYEHMYDAVNNKPDVQMVAGHILDYVERVLARAELLESDATYSENFYILLNYGLWFELQFMTNASQDDDIEMAAHARKLLDVRIEKVLGDYLWEDHVKLLKELGPAERRKYLDTLMKNMFQMDGTEDDWMLENARDHVRELQAKYLDNGRISPVSSIASFDMHNGSVSGESDVEEDGGRISPVSSVASADLHNGSISSDSDAEETGGGGEKRPSVTSIESGNLDLDVQVSDESDGEKAGGGGGRRPSVSSVESGEINLNVEVSDDSEDEGKEEVVPSATKRKGKVIPEAVMQRVRRLSRTISRSNMFTDDLKTMLERARARIDVNKALQEVIHVVQAGFGGLFSDLAGSEALTTDEFKVYNEFNGDVLHIFKDYWSPGVPGDALTKLDTLFRQLIKAMRAINGDQLWDIQPSTQVEDEFFEVYGRFEDHWRHLLADTRRILKKGFKPATQDERDAVLTTKPKTKKQLEKERKAAERAARVRGNQQGLSEDEESTSSEGETSSDDEE